MSTVVASLWPHELELTGSSETGTPSEVQGIV